MTNLMWLAGAAVVLASVSAQQPEGRGTPAEAEAMLVKAIAHYETAGRTQALADFTARKAPFADRDLYVFCFAADRKVIAHGGDAKQIGVIFDTRGASMARRSEPHCGTRASRRTEGRWNTSGRTR